MQPAPKILVIEDEWKTRASIVEGFILEGWRVLSSGNGEQAKDILNHDEFDLIVLDWMLPGVDGVTLLRDIRRTKRPTPVLMLTVRDSISDRVEGLEAGADDYVTKPFAFAELIARCRALLRRPILGTGRVLSCGGLELDTRARAAIRDGREVNLTPREVDILEYLLRHQGRVVTREMLERDIWKQTRRYTSLNNVIDVQMMRLRRKVDDGFAMPLIRTQRGVGYILSENAPPVA